MKDSLMNPETFHLCVWSIVWSWVFVALALVFLYQGVWVGSVLLWLGALALHSITANGETKLQVQGSDSGVDDGM